MSNRENGADETEGDERRHEPDRCRRRRGCTLDQQHDNRVAHRDEIDADATQVVDEQDVRHLSGDDKGFDADGDTIEEETQQTVLIDVHLDDGEP